MNAAGTHYIISNDGLGHATVGYGVDIFNGGFEDDFKAAGYSTAEGTEVPIEFVDALEEQEIQDCLEKVKAATSGLDLTQFQINALVSRAFNAGISGAIDKTRGSPPLNFVASYSTYWNQERDCKYDEEGVNLDNTADFNHALYVQYMKYPNTSDGKYVSGLQKRRDDEWTLFQTGYYGGNGKVNKWHTDGGDIITVAEEIHKYMEDNQYTYCVYGGNSYEECGSYGKSHGLNSTFEASKTNYQNTCCATFVSWVLQGAGYITPEEHSEYGLNSANSMRDFLKGKGWIVITNSSELQPGDVICYDHHVEIYAGDGTIYNAGSGSSIRNAAPAQGTRINKMMCGLRAPY